MKYILKDGEYDGIIPGIGDVRHGVPIEPFTPEQEELLKADPRFKQYREPKEDAPVTGSGTVEGEQSAADTGKKKAAAPKDGNA